MTDRICPRCTNVIIIPCVDRDHHPTGWWQCARPECALEWQEREPAAEGIPAPVNPDKIRGGEIT